MPKADGDGHSLRTSIFQSYRIAACRLARLKNDDVSRTGSVAHAQRCQVLLCALNKIYSPASGSVQLLTILSAVPAQLIVVRNHAHQER